MGGVFQKSVGQCLVYHDGSNENRWYDVIGGTAVKVLEDFQYVRQHAADSLAEWTVTLVETGAGDTTVAPVAGANGGTLLITTDAADNDGANLQVKGECFSFASVWPAYFGIRFKVSEATQSDFLAGLCITDTDLLQGMTDGIYFRKVDAATGIAFVMEKNSVETEIAGVHVCVDDTFVVLEFVYDGATVRAFVDGVEKARIDAGNANFPNDEFLTPSVQFLTGAAAAETMTVDWVRAIQVQG